MKSVAVASAIALAASVAFSPMAMASGWIVIDPISGAPPVRPPVRTVPTPGRPGVVVPRPGQRPMLHGSVSYGLHLKGETVKVDIKDQVAKTYISQTFSNDTERDLAGTYLFPLPDDTTFSSFSLFIDGRPVEGKILEASAARAEYESIVRQNVDPGLLEYADYKTVRARIFPIPARGTKKVELEYTQVLRAENGMLKYRFPLKAKGGDEPIDEMKIDVKLASKQPIHTIWSPTHTINSTRKSDHDALVGYVEKSANPDKDFLLYYSVSDKELSANVLTHKREAEDGYFMLTLTPPLGTRTQVGKDIVIVADTSGSMQGEKMDQNRKALKYIIEALAPEDHFGLVQFNTDAEAFKPKLLPATAENKKLAVQYIDDLEARGGTNISDAMSTANTILAEASPRPAYVVLITDGEPTVGETDVTKLLAGVKSKRDVRVFDFGVGYDVNTRLLNKLAEEHHGTSQYVEPDENLETALSGFYQKIKSPVLSDVKIAYDGIEVKDVYPKSVKDIFAGSQVLLIGKYKGSGNASVKLTGQLNGVAKAYSFPLTFTAEEADHSYLPRIWAMRRIGYLTDIAKANSDTPEVTDEIIALSKKYGIISAYTSYLVTDPAETERIRRERGGMRPLPMGRVSMAPARSSGSLPRVSFGTTSRRGMVPPPPAMTLSTAAAPAWGGDELMEFAPVHRIESGMGGPAAGAPGGGGGFSSTPVHGRLLKASRPHRASDDGPVVADARVRGGLPAARLDSFAARSTTGASHIYGDEGVASLPGFWNGKGASAFIPATKSESGKDAVVVAKTLNQLKESSNLRDKNIFSGAMKNVEDKTFYMVNGFWTDSTFEEGRKAKEIVFGSTEYFDLMKKTPAISKFLSVGKQVIIEFNGSWYKIIQPEIAKG